MSTKTTEKDPLEMSSALREALESGMVQGEQLLRELITIEAHELGLSYDEAVALVKEGRMPASPLGSDIEFTLQLIDPTIRCCGRHGAQPRQSCPRPLRPSEPSRQQDGHTGPHRAEGGRSARGDTMIVPRELREALESSTATREQMRELVTLEAHELGLTYEEAVALVKEGRMPASPLGSDIEFTLQLIGF